MSYSALVNRLPTFIAIAGLAALAAPAGASAATRAGTIQDPQGDASALNGPALDLRSFAVTYDDVAGTLRMTWTYYDDVRPSLSAEGGPGGAGTAANPVAAGVQHDYAAVQWSSRRDESGAWSIPATLQLYGTSGSLTGNGSLSSDGRSVTTEFTNPALAGRDWRRSFGSNYNGDTYETFWFDGFEPAPPTPPPPVYSPPPSGAPDPGSSEPPAAPTSGPTGMSINNGAQYTNDPSVTLAVIAPSGAPALRVANDGGFLKARTFPVTRTVKWRLEESGSERLPKTVYLRFGNQSQTFTDDIILDQTKPTTTSASLVGSAAPRAVALTRAASKVRTYKVRVRAKDSASGVGKLQFAVKTRRPGKLTKFVRVAKMKGVSAPRFVRVQDRAGNYSRWRPIR